MSSFTEKITQIVTVELPSLLERISSQNQSFDETSQELYIQEIDSLIIKTVRNFSLSLLKGEYVHLKGIKESCLLLKNNLNLIKDGTISFQVSLQNKILEYLTTIGFLIDTYTFFINEILNYFSEEKRTYAFSKKSRLNRISKSLLNSSTQDALNYFSILVSLNEIDHFPSNTNEYIHIIFELESDLLELNIREYEDITKNVLVKVDFLKHKWKQRKFDENPDSIYYRIDGDIRTVEDYSGTNAKLKEWVEIIQTQYELISANWKNELKNRVKPYKNKPLTELTFLQIHQLIKYNKDVKNDLSSLNHLCDELSNRLLLSNEGSYENYILGIAYNYALNNKFSLFLEDEPKYEAVKSEYLTVKSGFQGNVNNFFLSFKYLEYLGRLFLKKILDGEKTDFVNKYEGIVKYLWNEVEEYFEQKEWCKNHHNYVFILPYEESLVATTDLNDLNSIFYASSFVLPPSHTKIEKDYIKVKEYFEEVRLYIRSGKHFRTEIDKIKNLNEELDKKDFKSIEIISIFTAIITFVLSSIPSYKFVDSVFESVLFMLSLASSLSLFIILILFTTRNLFKKWQAYVAIIILLLVSSLGYYKLFQQETNTKRKAAVNVKATIGKNKNSKE